MSVQKWHEWMSVQAEKLAKSKKARPRSMRDTQHDTWEESNLIRYKTAIHKASINTNKK